MAYLPFLIPCSGMEFTINRLGLPKPKFKIGDRIQHRYICDDKLDKENYLKLNILRGVILWMLPDTKLKQWQYFVLWDDQNPEYFVFDSPDTEDHFEPSWEIFPTSLY